MPCGVYAGMASYLGDVGLAVALGTADGVDAVHPLPRDAGGDEHDADQHLQLARQAGSRHGTGRSAHINP